METIKLIVKSILVVIMLASFLEIILPRSEMKRYINLIIGLFIIFSILNPLFNLAKQDIAFDVFDDVPGGTADTNTIINKGKAISQEQKETAVREYKEKLSKQILGLSGLYQGGAAGRADVEMVDDPANPDFGQIKKIILYMADKNAKNELEGQVHVQGGIKSSPDIKVEEITVNPENSKSQPTLKTEPGNDKDALKKAIANFYGIEINQVEIRK